MTTFLKTCAPPCHAPSPRTSTLPPHNHLQQHPGAHGSRVLDERRCLGPLPLAHGDDLKLGPGRAVICGELE